MGANLLILFTAAALQSLPQDTTVDTTRAARQIPGRAGPRDSVAAEDESAPPPHGFAFERLSDLLQYNRVQGLSLGVGYQAQIPGVRFTGVYGTLRYGLSDERVTGRVTLLRDSPWGRLGISGYRDLADLDPFSPGRNFSNTFNALIAGHDNGDYALVEGGSLSFATPVGPALELILTAKLERLSSARAVARSAVNDFFGGTGWFPPNPAVEEGTFGDGAVRLSHAGATRWNLTADGLSGTGRITGRLFGDVRRNIGSRQGLTIRVKAGVGSEPGRPQTLFRLGGLNSVRGFEYGVIRATAFWAGQLDLAPLGGRVRPVLFLDAGQAASLGDLFSSEALVGGGVGLSLFGGLIRFDLSHPISPRHGEKLRLDLVIRGVR